MTLRIEDTTSSKVIAAIAAERHRLGAQASGMVLTLIIVTDEHEQADATQAATFSANQHPCRIVVIIPRPGRGSPRLDAEIDLGDREGPCETVKLRLRGPLADKQASVVLPLLLADTPVVAWWPGTPPPFPAADSVGVLAQRRITDAAAVRQSLAMLDHRAETYTPGDTDLAWTRITPWRSMLATALDEPYDEITSVNVGAQRGNPSGPLLASWLHARLQVPVSLQPTRGPGVTAVTLETVKGPITLSRPTGRMASLSRPYLPTRKIPLPRRELKDLLSEELRRLDSDEIYAQALEHLSTRPQRKSAAKDADEPVSSPELKATAEKVPTPAKKAAATKAAKKAPPVQKAVSTAKEEVATKPVAKKTAAKKAVDKKAAAKEEAAGTPAETTPESVTTEKEEGA